MKKLLAVSGIAFALFAQTTQAREYKSNPRSVSILNTEGYIIEAVALKRLEIPPYKKEVIFGSCNVTMIEEEKSTRYIEQHEVIPIEDEYASATHKVVDAIFNTGKGDTFEDLEKECGDYFSFKLIKLSRDYQVILTPSEQQAKPGSSVAV